MDRREVEAEDRSIQHPDYRQEIAEIIRSGLAPKPMRDRLLDYHENDIAMALGLLTKEERRRLYGMLDHETLANILEYSDDLNLYLDELSLRRRVEMLSRLEVPVAVRPASFA